MSSLGRGTALTASALMDGRISVVIEVIDSTCVERGGPPDDPMHLVNEAPKGEKSHRPTGAGTPLNEGETCFFKTRCRQFSTLGCGAFRRKGDPGRDRKAVAGHVAGTRMETAHTDWTASCDVFSDGERFLSVRGSRRGKWGQNRLREERGAASAGG
jgi:hypothetical protein